LAGSKTKSSAFSGSFRASSPANWADSVSFIRAVWVAKRSALYKLWWANQWFTVCQVSVIRVLGTGDANVIHTGWAIG